MISELMTEIIRQSLFIISILGETFMRKAFIITLCLCLALLPLTVATSAQSQQSAAQKSALRARETVEACIKAMGGLQALQAIQDVTREFAGTRSDQGQGMQPVPPAEASQPPVTSTYARFTSIRDLKNNRAIEYREAEIFGGQPIRFKSIITPAMAFSINEVTKTYRQIPPAGLAQARAGFFRRHPESLLQTAWSRPESLRWLGEEDFEGRKERGITFADSDGTVLTLFFDAQTNLLTRTEQLFDDAIAGDARLETIYTDWRPQGKLVLPYRYIDRIAGSVFQDVKLTSIQFDTHPADTLFAQPEGLSKLDPPAQIPTVKKIGEDAYALLGTYNSMFIVFKDYVLVVEAGASTAYANACIAEIKKIVPDKPIRYLVSTHFHFDHVSGVRRYVAEGTTVVTTPAAKTVIERAASASHMMRPDMLSRQPRAAVIETFTGKRVFDDGVHRLELYEFSNPHCGQMIVAYLPKEKLLFEADMLDLDLPEDGTAAAGRDTADLAEQIRKLGLQVETIIPVHGRMGTIAELQKALAARK
jgi:glyoxylase-like metal-dependent hydrolase (beta-lactamase superfamily II)